MPDGVHLPGAVWKPFTERTVSITPWTGPLTWIIHTIGKGSALGAWHYHNQVGKPYVQLYYDNHGVPYQTTGLQYRAAGTLELNPYVIASETADYGPGFGEWDGKCGHVPPFTDEQVAGYIRDLTWTFLRFGGNPVLMTETCSPLGGIGWHRLSIDPWRQAGCLEGSTTPGKCCPDDARISQIIHDIQPDVARNVAAARKGDGDLDANERSWLIDIHKAIVQRLDGTTGELLAHRCRLLKPSSGVSHWYVTDGITKREVIGHEHANFLVDAMGVEANGKDANGNYMPFLVPAADLDAIVEVKAEAVVPPA
jgi:hypothetical protein